MSNRIPTYRPAPLVERAATHKAYDATRSEGHRDYWKASWKKLRASVLAERPLCQDCAQDGLVVVATLVHHEDEVEQGNPVLTTTDRLTPLCRTCHTKRHRPRGRAGLNP